ncbi:MAG: hypothetical protein NZL93_04350, partial [Chthoniobacterales bacterium]|nr:hypothetical protein [Chthoniobacterales bacterium]
KSPTAFPTSAPVTSWTAGLAAQIHSVLFQNYGTEYAEFIDDAGLPVYNALIGSDMLHNMIREDADIRQDFRFAYMGSGRLHPLLQTLPVDVAKRIGKPASAIKVYRGWAYYLLHHPRRWDLVGGNWVERLPYSSTPSPVSVGVGHTEISQAYRQAQFEDVIIFNRNAFKLIIPKMPARIGKAEFGLVATTGEFTWHNDKFLQVPVLDANGNPTGQTCQNLNQEWGFWRMNFLAGMLPQIRNLAIVVRVRRCPIKLNAISCVSSY